ncbi:MAG TPA: hypothetical protein VNK26_07180 [Pyrinomonadaceae bacterium]|nr:hypothetical protein [Pyrinomonadaceae bacterium]
MKDDSATNIDSVSEQKSVNGGESEFSSGEEILFTIDEATYREFEASALKGKGEKLGETFLYVIKHPIETAIIKWNWKAAVLSALLRAPIFFFSYFFKKDGLKLALGAALAQSVFRFLFGGVNGAIIQAFSRVEPAWHAVLTVPIVLAVMSHIIEFAVQTVYDHQMGVQGRWRAILISIAVSAVSAVFNLFAMRRGALLVKDESKQSLWRDLKSMPWIILEFLSFPLVWTYRRSRSRRANA